MSINTPEQETRIRDFTPANLPPIPHLAGLQRASFERFLQPDCAVEARADQGLEGLFRRMFRNHPETAYLGYELVPGATAVADCLCHGRTYGVQLRVILEKRGSLSGEASGKTARAAGTMPMMTSRGTFVIEGREVVVVGCLQGENGRYDNDLRNCRLLLVGEQLQLALADSLAADATAQPQESETCFPKLADKIRQFFTRGATVRTAETRNPLSLASQLRLVIQTGTAKGPEYLARCPHPTHFGRVGLLETPEGERIGINLTTAILADMDADGRILTPFTPPDEPESVQLLGAEEDSAYVIGDRATPDLLERYHGGIPARVGDDLHRVLPGSVDLVPVHPFQPFGVSASLIPFLGHDDANRALMGANMQKQAMPLLHPEPPWVQSGMERQVAGDMEAQEGWGAVNGVLALGHNLLTGFMCWEGYNYEDGIVVSDEVIDRGLLDTVQTWEYRVAIRDDGDESLDPAVLVREGANVAGGDILIGKSRLAPDGQSEETSIRMPRGMHGKVTCVLHDRAGDEIALGEGVREFVCVRVEAPRPLRVGDKLATRHGGKGVVTRIVPMAEMPVLPDGRRLQILMNPLGVPSRMNIGTLLETHMGLAAHDLGITVITPGFQGASVNDIEAMLREAGLPESGMLQLRDGRNGRLFDQETTVGYLYFMRVDQMVEDKRQERATGPYDPETCQPVRGRRNGGGQHFGIMEIWALQGHHASHILYEMLTLKSDDVAARSETYAALVEGRPLPPATVPESVRRLVRQLRGLCLDLELLDTAGRPLDVFSSQSSLSTAVRARLGFADAGTIRTWPGREIVSPTDLATADGYIQLAVPVTHSWHPFLQDEPFTVPALTVLPVISRELRAGTNLDVVYAAVLEKNEECRRGSGAESAKAALQHSVDTLLNALTRKLHGKRGWITETLSGKTVDYSARSVVCPGPDLDCETCSLPIRMAAVLFEPLAVGELLRTGEAATQAEAQSLLACQAPSALAALERVVADRYVLLHRAPALHRLSIQAFRVRLADEDVIRIHPLTTIAFNADFDGDEMDVFLPLGPEAQKEARERLAASFCQLSPAHGGYLSGPSQDMVLGCYYATCAGPDENVAAPPSGSLEEFARRHATGELSIHATVRVDDRITTLGRALFNQCLPPGLVWFDQPASKRELWNLLNRVWHECGRETAARLANTLMCFGFRQATLSGLSIGKDTLRQTSTCVKRLNAGWTRAERIIADSEDARDHHSACSELALHWMAVVRGITDAAMRELAADQGGLNSVHLMLASGARATPTQVRQHIAIRGLMTLPDNRILRCPVTTNFLKGHSLLEYTASTYGARRGLADTAVKSADAGFLFKRIMNAVQDVVIVCETCGTSAGIVKTGCRDDSGEWLPLADRIRGRVLATDVIHPKDGTLLLKTGDPVWPRDAEQIVAAGITAVEVRSPLTCQAHGGICAHCFGLDPATWQFPEIGLPVGVVAVQSIGEPAAQLTMRTFHVAVPPKCEPETRRSVRPDILGGLPRVSQIFEAWAPAFADSQNERENVAAILAREGLPVAADYLLRELQKTFRTQGVRIDDRHFEIVLKNMLENGLRGISELAADDRNFLAAGTAYGGIAALARYAAARNENAIDSVRGCTAFCHVMP